MVSRSSNFQDPIGLVLRMLASGNRAAYAALTREVLRYGVIPVDRLLEFWERRQPEPCSEHPVLLIVGAPRSGTSLVYQALSQYLDVSFPSNGSVMFSRAPITAARLQQRLRTSRRPSFRSFYGQTCRLTDTNDGFEIWNRWLGSDRYQPARELTDEQIADMRSFFARWTGLLDKPLLNKNNRNALAIRLLADCLPQARFIVVRRNPVMVAQSLITARKRIQGDVSAAWGLQARSVASDDCLSHVDAVFHQLADIETQMAAQLQQVANDRVFSMTYEGFCEQPASMTRSLADRFAGVTISSEQELDSCEPFRVSDRQQVSDAELARLHDLLEHRSSPLDAGCQAER